MELKKKIDFDKLSINKKFKRYVYLKQNVILDTNEYWLLPELQDDKDVLYVAKKTSTNMLLEFDIKYAGRFKVSDIIETNDNILRFLRPSRSLLEYKVVRTTIVVQFKYKNPTQYECQNGVNLNEDQINAIWLLEDDPDGPRSYGENRYVRYAVR